jgi:hypothetical protein
MLRDHLPACNVGAKCLSSLQFPKNDIRGSGGQDVGLRHCSELPLIDAR